MPESEQQFDFTKPEDQERFFALSGEEREAVVAAGHDEVLAMQALQQMIITLGEGYIINALEIKQKFNLPDEVL
ncbi:MAG: hypothetical protein HY974_02770, partial [Candidatus Kerfeldbacteria bacterium]|nr:hypothetical protein [Candidatus Kerfeldbacteria bacterium]